MKNLKILLIEKVLNYPLEKVYPFFLDFDKFGKLHPVIHQTNKINDGVTRESRGVFSVKESILLFGFLPLKPIYVAEVFEIEKDKKIRYYSKINQWTELEIFYQFNEINPGETSITETVKVAGNSLVCKILLNQIKKLHNILYENLEEELSWRPITLLDEN